jgi:hypothetical protein
MVRACDQVDWTDMTVGRACLDAMGTIVGTRFADVAQAKAWVAAHPAPLDSYDYWRQVLSTRPANQEQLDRLARRGPELFVRVTAQEPELLGERGEPIFSKAARDVGADRLLRVLRREASWPELDGSGFDTFATTIFRRAGTIFDAQHGASLLALWEDRSRFREEYVWVALAVAVSRVVSQESRRVLTQSLRSCSSAQEPLLEELARRHALEEKALLLSWYGTKPVGHEDAFATAIFTGLADAGAQTRPVLSSLVRKRAPSSEDRSAVVALVAATKAAGHAMPASCDGHLFARMGKGTLPEDRRRSEREVSRTRKACVNEAIRVLRL